MWRRWNELGSLGRFELWTRASVYVLLAAVLVVLAVVLAAGHQVREPGLAVFLLLSVARAGVCIALLHAAWAAIWQRDRHRTGGWSPQPPR